MSTLFKRAALNPQKLSAPLRESNPLDLYADESIHDRLGFIATAFVISDKDLEKPIKKALLSAGLRSGKDEFRSGIHMAGNPKMQVARQALHRIAVQIPRIALFITSNKNRPELGKECLNALELVFRRNEINPKNVSAFFDEGIFPSETEAKAILNTRPYFCSMGFHPQENSKIRLGIQLADLVAHSAGQIIRETLSGKPKIVNIGGPDTGYDDGEEASLSWSLLMSLRYRFFTRPIVYKKEHYNLEPNPMVVGPDDDPVNVGINPELLGWGVHIGRELPEEVQIAVKQAFNRIWLGCIH